MKCMDMVADCAPASYESESEEEEEQDMGGLFGDDDYGEEAFAAPMKTLMDQRNKQMQK